MDVRPLSRRRFFGGVAAAMGVLGFRPTSGLFAQGGTAQFTGGAADYDRFAKLASNENNWGPPESVMKAMTSSWKYANRYGYPDGNIVQAIADHHGVKPENILLTAGSSEVLQVVGTTFLQGGKKVLGVEPSYNSVYQHATNLKSEAIKLPLTGTTARTWA
jgi:histidinol-phosphate aminotransferase